MCLHDLGRRQGLVAAVDGLDDACSEVLESNTTHIIQAHDGLSVIAALADAGYHRNLSQQLHVQVLGELLAAVMPEDVVFLVGMAGGSEP